MKKIYNQPITTTEPVYNLNSLCDVITQGSDTDDPSTKKRNELDQHDDKKSTDYGTLW